MMELMNNEMFLNVDAALSKYPKNINSIQNAAKVIAWPPLSSAENLNDSISES